MSDTIDGVRSIPAAGPDTSTLRELVRPFDDCAYVYAALDTPRGPERSTRWRALAAMLRVQGAPDDVINALATLYSSADAGPGRLALVAGPDGGIRYHRRLTAQDPVDRAGFTAPPSIVPLLAETQARPPFVLAVVDHSGAELTASEGGHDATRTWTVSGPDDEIESNAPGGWSQPRYQRRAIDSWKHNARAVARHIGERVADVGAQVLVLSGDVRAVELVTAELPKHPSLILRHIAGSRAQDGSQAHRDDLLAAALADAAATQTNELLEILAEGLSPTGAGVDGIEATFDALANGRVAWLLVSDAAADRVAWFGHDATEVWADHDDAARTGRPARVGAAADVAIRAALLSGARVRIVPADAPHAPSQGLGAICRFR